jgi:thymidylate synthase (FAD)
VPTSLPCRLRVVGIFVARQWIRHRTANVNEYSARYSILDKEFYIPDRRQLAAQSTQNRQGRTNLVDDAEADGVLALLRRDSERAYEGYAELLNEDEAGVAIDPARAGLARELARINLSLNFYTQWYWKIDLHNLMHFLRLRADSHAQYEIRAYAEQILSIVKLWVPITYDAFEEYVLGGVSLSRTSVQVIRRLLAGEKLDQASSGLSIREWQELTSVLGLTA